MDALLGADFEQSDNLKFKKVETSAFKRFLIKIGIVSDKNDVEDYVKEPEVPVVSDKDKLEAELKDFDTKEFMTQLELFKFYMASNFYDDNIGRIELVDKDDNIVHESFQIPEYIQHLTPETREKVPYYCNQVSQ